VVAGLALAGVIGDAAAAARDQADGDEDSDDEDEADKDGKEGPLRRSATAGDGTSIAARRVVIAPHARPTAQRSENI
jgi:hypothetical protein